MGTKRGISVVLAALAILALAFWEWSRPREPVYQGKSLSAWVRELPAEEKGTRGVVWAPLSGSRSKPELAAEDALRHLGTNALPILVRLMHSREKGLREAVASVKEWSLKAYQRIFSRAQTPGISGGVYEYHKTTAEKEHWDAARGLNALGPLAKPAIPELEKILNGADLSLDACPDAAYALGAMGPEGLAALRRTMTNAPPPARGDWPQICAIWAAGQNPDNCAAALPELLTLLQDPDATVRMSAAWALGRIRTQPELEVPALAASVHDTGFNIRSMAEQALKEYGLASLTEPSLVKYLDDPQLQVRMAATNAARVLFPDDAATAGVPEQ